MKVIVFIIAYFAAVQANITFENCHKGNDSVAVIRKLTVSPYPPSLSKNISATVDLELFKDLPDNILVKTNIYKVTGIFGIPVPAPCFAGLGSCTQHYCKLFDKFREQACPFFPKSVECDCPVKANVYAGQNITIVPPSLGPIIKFIASGQFRIEARLIDKDTKKELFCYIFKGKATP
ncbi:ML domain-containing protein [Trichonephila clavipes]|nr:ML domain-containing protein [Trichonephila clavipes]